MLGSILTILGSYLLLQALVYILEHRKSHDILVHLAKNPEIQSVQVNYEDFAEGFVRNDSQQYTYKPDV